MYAFLDRVRNVLAVVLYLAFIKSPVLNSGDEDSGKLMSAVASTQPRTESPEPTIKRRKFMAGRPPFDQFDTESEDIESCLEKLQEYFTTYDIADDEHNPAKRRAILLTSILGNWSKQLYSNRTHLWGRRGVLKDTTYLRTLPTTFYWLLNLN